MSHRPRILQTSVQSSSQVVKSVTTLLAWFYMILFIRSEFLLYHEVWRFLRFPCYLVAKCQIWIIDSQFYCFDGNMQGPSTWLNCHLGHFYMQWMWAMMNKWTYFDLPSFIWGDWVKAAALDVCMACAHIFSSFSEITEDSSQFFLCHVYNSLWLLLDDYGRLSWSGDHKSMPACLWEK